MEAVPSPYETMLAANPGRQHQATVDGVATCYWTYGPSTTGPVLVVVHGFRGDHHGLEPVLAHLPERRVVAPDLPGFGRSAPFPTGRHTVEAYADWLISFVRQLSDAGPVVCWGTRSVRSSSRPRSLGDCRRRGRCS